MTANSQNDDVSLLVVQHVKKFLAKKIIKHVSGF